jgi:eukaryotic-like serine/threonine-protein kinase
LSELRRRRVFKAVASYAVVAWLLIQVVVSVEGPLDLPPWSDTFVIVASIIGFPVCALLAWFYDFTRRGIERTADADAGQVEPLRQGDRWTIGLAGAAATLLVATSAYFLIGRPGPVLDTIALSPFALVDVDANTAYLGDGLRDSLVTRLSRLKTLRIKTIASTDAEIDAAALGRRLDAEAVCSGRVLQRGDSIEIIVELVDADDGAILWREEYSTTGTSLLAIEADISEEIARRLGLELGPDAVSTLRRAPTSNPAAHRLYQQGRYFWNRRTLDGLEASIDYYNRAIALDPNYALAYAGLADSYLMLLGWGLRPPNEVSDLVVQSARRAIQRDSSLAQPHAALGYLKTIHELDWEGARAEFLQAIALDGNYSSAHHWYAFLLMTEGNMTAALEEINLARELEPLSPIINAEVGYFYIFDRQYERAISELEAASLLDPNYPSTVSYLTRAYALLGRRDAALENVERLRTTSDDDLFRASYSAMVLPLIGLEEQARQVYRRALEASETGYIMRAVLGLLAGTLGDNDAAFEHFERALDEGSLVVSWLRDPLLDALRDDPRYTELMARIGLPP